MDNVISFAEYLIKELVLNPDDVIITTRKKTGTDGNEVTVILAKVHADDIGLCIGKDGEHAKMIRQLICLVGYKYIQEPIHFEVDTANSYHKGY